MLMGERKAKAYRGVLRITMKGGISSKFRKDVTRMTRTLVTSYNAAVKGLGIRMTLRTGWEW
jgi:hypothetical protein